MAWARRNSWWVFALLCAALIVVYFSIPLVSAWSGQAAASQSLVWAALAATTVAAMTLGVAIHRPPAQAAWALLTVGVALLGAANAFWDFPQLVGLPPRDIPFPSILNYLHLASYLVLFAGVMLLIRRRSPGRDRAALLDALIVTTAAALTSWIVHHRTDLVGHRPRRRGVAGHRRLPADGHPAARRGDSALVRRRLRAQHLDASPRDHPWSEPSSPTPPTAYLTITGDWT